MRFEYHEGTLERIHVFCPKAKLSHVPEPARLGTCWRFSRFLDLEVESVETGSRSWPEVV